MKHILLFVFLVFNIILGYAQKDSKISTEINYGLTGNFFVINSHYGESGGPSSLKFYNKNFIGRIGGVEIKYRITKSSSVGFAYSKSTNSKEVNFSGTIINATIKDWEITHTDKFFQLFYERNFTKEKNKFKYQIGLFYLRMNQQEIEIKDYPSGGIIFEERNFNNSKLEEGGFFVGLHYTIKIDTKFDLGIKSRLYYLTSVNAFEAITLTPTLSFNF